LIEYMTTTKAGKRLGKQVSRGEHGEDFNKPTGKIYNETQLLKRLKTSYDAETLRRAKSRPAAIAAPEVQEVKPASPAAEKEESKEEAQPLKADEPLPNDPFE